MITFISALLYTIQLVLQHGDCLNLIDLQQGGAAHSPEWKLGSRRPPAMYGRLMTHTLPRKREIKSNFRRYWHGNKKPRNNIFFKSSRRVFQDERDTNLKNKLASLVKQTMHGTETRMKDIEAIKEAYREEEAYKAGFVLSLLKKSRDVVDELFNVAIKHRDEWQALEQLKIFEIIVHANIDTTNLLYQLNDIKKGLDVFVEPSSALYEYTDKIYTPPFYEIHTSPATHKSRAPATDETYTAAIYEIHTTATDKIDTPAFYEIHTPGTDKIDTPAFYEIYTAGTDEIHTPGGRKF